MKACHCIGENAVEIIGLDDPGQVDLFIEQQSSAGDGRGMWTQISVPEIFQLPANKPAIATIDKVFVAAEIISQRIVNTPVGPAPGQQNREGTRLTGRKLAVEGKLRQKVVYTADLPQQPVYFAHFETYFSAFIVLSPNDDYNEFWVEAAIEDVFAIPFNPRQIFKNITLFLQAKPLRPDNCLSS